MSKINLILYSPGLGYINRGLETFTRELYEAVHEAPELTVTLFQGRGDDIVDGSRVVWAPRRTSTLYDKLPFHVPRGRRYFIENLVFSLPIIKAAYQQEQSIIHFSESLPARVLYKLREQFGGQFKLLLSNGGPMSPEHATRFDYMQVVTPFQEQQMLNAGYPSENLFLVPYGLNSSFFHNSRLKSALQERREVWGLPQNRIIILSVGAINAHTKRMDWLIKEFSKLDVSKYFLWMVGQKEGEEANDVEQLAASLLPEDGYQFTATAYSNMPAVYHTADLFALCSLHEGFGRVYIEAMASECPVLAHPTPNTEWILGGENPGLVAMDETGALATQIEQMADDEALRSDLSTSNQKRAYEMFDWGQLKADYIEMYEEVARR